MSGNVPFRCKIGLKIETQWADIVCLVFQNYRLLGLVLQVWFHVATLLFAAHSVSAQNRSGPMHEIPEGGMGGVAVHAKQAIRSCGGTTGSPRGTTLLVQPLYIYIYIYIILILKHKTHDISPFKPILHRNGTFTGMGSLSKLYLLSPLSNP